jgi:hypothetical protein
VRDPSTSRFRTEIAKLSSAAKAAAASTQQTGKSEVPLLVLILLPSVELIGDANRRITANLAGMQMLVALRRYELTHGHLPAALAEAAAETSLKSVPIDPYSGQPLRFALVDGTPIVYAVGKDIQDDGGRADWKFGQQPGDYLFVFTPRPETKLTPPQPANTPAAAPPAPTVRTWTSTAGTTMEAELLGVQDGVAALKKRDGSTVRVPLDKLSSEDQAWIRSDK